ncbi:MAG: hypothetical protein A2X86_00120 [Bdellovibrionales bacterium GWA2_49_15]|nr:MAG: hypothetical protein A2X86_00120 [Bdellovibrionales bacterium GWA2_49_15]HAZ14447.1 hypothetical protein [Bdellovibrionales bacterium]
MSELQGISLTRHLDSILEEFKSSKTIYDFPFNKMYRGQFSADLSVNFHGTQVATPLGPAAGPHTQLAQNIVLAFLGGSRIFELKTVQILDHLEIPRPCIDARNVCYNVEWSQELSLKESAREYVKAWLLLHFIRELELLGVERSSSLYNVHFDLSVGYDLKGISSPQMTAWFRQMQNARELIAEQLSELPSRYHGLKKSKIPTTLSNSVTLSTFHGCPGGEIEKIVEYLMGDLGLHVIVKMNPTLLGFERVQQILHHDLGYAHLVLLPKAFETDLNFEQAVAMMERLQAKAKSFNRFLGAKFTNTLVVGGEHSKLPGQEQYLSGPPLHVLAMEALHKFREKMGADFPVSFSAGLEAANVADTLACNIVPVTVCTDLLKIGGYTRLNKYFKNIEESFAQMEVSSLSQFILKRAKNAPDLAQAGFVNTRDYLKTLAKNSRYHFEKNQRLPKKSEKKLDFFECLTCNICMEVCPNAANFLFPVASQEFSMSDYRWDGHTFVAEGKFSITLEKGAEIANLAEFCNDCSNCDTFCPEVGGPYLVKPKLFLEKNNYEKYSGQGFYLEGNTILGKFDGAEYVLKFHAKKLHYEFISEMGTFLFDEDRLLSFVAKQERQRGDRAPLDKYLKMKILLTGLMKSGRYGATLLHRGQE